MHKKRKLKRKKWTLSFQTGGFQQYQYEEDMAEVIMNIDKVGLGPLLNRMLGRRWRF